MVRLRLKLGRLNVNTLSYGNLNYGYSSAHLLGRHLLAGFELSYIVALASHSQPTQKLLLLSYAGMWKRGSKTIYAGLDQNRQSFNVNYTAKLDYKTQVGADFSYDLQEAFSKTTLVRR